MGLLPRPDLELAVNSLSLHSLQCRERADSAWGCLYFSWERAFVPLFLVALRWKSCRQEGADFCQTVSTTVVACVRQPSPPVPWAILGSVTPSGARLEPLSWPPSCGAWSLQACYHVPLEVLLQIWWGCPLVGVELLRVALTGAFAERVWLV